MCELFGASMKSPTDFKELLKEFYSHGNKHPHGWGIMRKGNSGYEVISEPVCSLESQIIDDVVANTSKQTNILAHIRLATVGTLIEENTHPFTGRDVEGRSWYLIHNGTIYSGNKLISYLGRQKGNTDSERVFLYLMDLLKDEYNKTGSLSAEQRFQVVEKLVKSLSPRNKLNLIVFDGEIMYIHKNMDKTLSYQKRPEGIVFSTTALGEGWEDLEICRLFAYKTGELIMKSEEKSSEFIPTLDYINALAAMNI